MPLAHIFNTTREAYDASQCDDNIKDGDILIALKENVVGFLFDIAYPVALTENAGCFGKPTISMEGFRAKYCQYDETYAMFDSLVL